MKSVWNYRVLERDGEFSIHEVYYAPNGRIEAFTTEPVAPGGGSLTALKADLRFYRTALSRPTLEYRTLERAMQRHRLRAGVRRRYFKLVIVASAPDTEIWLIDDGGHPVQKASGELNTDLLLGDYVVEFGLGTQTYPVPLHRSRRLTQARLEAGPTCPKPIIKLDAGPG
ncbi:MAG: hypothetical protein ABI584_02630 [Acidobacteriota bacterium]